MADSDAPTQHLTTLFLHQFESVTPVALPPRHTISEGTYS